MKRGIYSIFIFYLLMSSPAVIGQIFGPSNYEDCVTKSMQGVTSDYAAQAIVAACASKYLEKDF